MITFYFIRHAESMGNVNNHLIGGQSNHYPLSDRGIHQSHLLGGRLRRDGYSFDHVFCSPAVRAQETCRIACEAMGIPAATIQATDQILELSQGDWEGQERKKIYTSEVVAEIQKDTHNFKAPNGESHLEVENRMYDWMEKTAKALGDKDATVAAFSHGFAIRTLVRKVMNYPASSTSQTMIHNTSITCFQYNGYFWALERVNDFAHLAQTDFIGHYG